MISAIWRTKLRSSLVEDHNIELQHCRDRGVVGIGWGIDDLASGASLEEVLSAGEQIDEPWWGSSTLSVIRHLGDVAQEGEYVWTRDVGGNYWVCQITGPFRYDNDEAAIAADIHQVRPAKWCDRPLSDLETPGAVIRSFVGQGQAFRRIGNEPAAELTPYLFRLGCGEALPKLDISPATMLRDHLGFDDLEDLIYVWMQVAKGYIAVPLARRPDTAAYEWTMLHSSDQHLGIPQIKSGETPVDLDKLRLSRISKTNRLFAFAASGRYEGSTDGIEIVDADELLKFIDEFRRFLPVRVRTWFDLAS